MMLTNIQSLKSKLDELTLIATSKDLDVICLTETWLSEDIEDDLVRISGYKIMRNDRKSRRGGGTAFYVKEGIAFQSLSTDNLPFDMEGTFLDFPSLNIAVLCVYIPPHLNTEKLKMANNRIGETIDAHLNNFPSRQTVVMGDFNHLEVKGICDDHNLTDVVTQPTRGRNTLDHILISEDLKNNYLPSQVFYESPIGKSDHLTLILSPKNLRHKFSEVRMCNVYDYRLSNIKALLCKAQNINWSSIIDPNDDVNLQWSKLHQVISTLMKKTIPQRKVIMTANDKSWMTPLTKTLINEKWTAYRTKDWQRFAYLKNKVKEEVKKAKSIWANKLKNSTNGLWRMTRKLSGKDCKNQLENLITQYRSPQNLAETIAMSIACNDPQTKNTPDNFDDDNWELTISAYEVWNQLRKLRPNKSAGCDDVPNMIYSLLSAFIAIPLCTIFNCSISQRKFPDDWKKGILVPIPKTNPPLLNRLRTVTLLPAPSKIFEKLILQRMRSKIDPLFGNCQHAYRKGLSTATALLQLYDTLTRLSDDQKCHGFALLSLDFTKAFDKVEHNILLAKINGRLPQGFVLWLKSYLSNRPFIVRIQGHTSGEYMTHAGVPQGSVLGPALFSILVGDLPSRQHGNVFVQYADDVNIVIPLQSGDENEIRRQITSQINEVEDWCTENKQSLNTAKTRMMIKTRDNCQNCDFQMNDQPETTDTLKLLGVHFNKNLTWDQHITAMNKKMCQRLHILRVLKNHVSRKELHQVYTAIIQSISDYCCPVFVNLPAKLTNKLKKVEKRAHRIIFGNERNCTCNMDGFTQRRVKLSEDLFKKILDTEDHILRENMPRTLPVSGRLSNFTCRTNKRMHSFFPYLTMLTNGSVTRDNQP